MTTAAEKRERNLRVAESLDARGWVTVLLTAFRENRLPGFEVSLEANPLTEITTLYTRASENVRAMMKAGVTCALAEYKHRLYGHSVLVGLAWTASAVRATDAVPELVNHVIGLSGHLGRDDRSEFVLAEELLSVLATFTPNPRVEFLFRNLLFDDAVHFRFAGTLAIGLVACDPAKFVPAVRRYVERREEGPEFFNDRSLMRGFFDAIPRAEIENSIGALGTLARRFVIDWADKLDVRKAYEGFPPEADPLDPETPASPPTIDFSSLNDMYYQATRISNLDALYVRAREH